MLVHLYIYTGYILRKYSRTKQHTINCTRGLYLSKRWISTARVSLAHWIVFVSTDLGIVYVLANTIGYPFCVLQALVPPWQTCKYSSPTWPSLSQLGCWPPSQSKFLPSLPASVRSSALSASSPLQSQSLCWHPSTDQHQRCFPPSRSTLT